MTVTAVGGADCVRHALGRGDLEPEPRTLMTDYFRASPSAPLGVLR